MRSANLRYANLSSADLSYANLSSADLSYANLRYADLRSANLSYANLIVLTLPFYTAYVQKFHTRIGCEYRTNKQWKACSDKTIVKMDSNALEFWNHHKQIIFAAMDSLQEKKCATHTKAAKATQ